MALWASSVHSNSLRAIFLVNAVSGFAILAKSRIQRLTTPTVPRKPRTSVGLVQVGHLANLAVTSWETCAPSNATSAPNSCSLGVANTIFDPEMVAPLACTLANNSWMVLAYSQTKTRICSFKSIKTSASFGYIGPIICWVQRWNSATEFVCP